MSSKQPSIRAQRVADLIKRQIADSLCKDIEDPRIKQLSITSVDVSPDLRNANVLFSILDDTHVDEVVKALNKAAGFLRRSIASRCELRYVPKLVFKYDDNLVEAENLVSLISEVSNDLSITDAVDGSEAVHE